MASLKEIKRKIKSTNNTQKTTKAMKLVSSAKLRKAEEAAKRSRLYAQKIVDVLSEISLSINKLAAIDKRFLFFNKREVKTVDIIFITADKGLCGGFNLKTIKAVTELMQDYEKKGIKVRLRAVGKKGIEFFKFQGIPLFKSYLQLSSSPTYEKSCELIQDAVQDYIDGNCDEVYIVYHGYKNMITQELKVEHLIPVEPSKIQAEAQSSSALDTEPEDDALINELLKTYFEYNMYFALINSLAAEHSARMQAMDNASKNAKEMVRMLDLAYNKARQASITTELIEIISGVESMK
ncbi:ATP synthase, F1 complex, gamma subunit [Campylobacter avium LMG 24591]|uniref:ATP synthase gamma chain n=1 Tax=Campylobacter avium LMG 24591 TaxID=522484 RepID=A0A222MXW2_9BACT|nr:ATP synthase F1 subunit gamma [Campylobacter avium]ASQ30974.1 ATP synthase, F1 complex, gamma subunit [Campylobacter avium LMG 24591]OYD78786.1 ATP synthase, F1 complex, gamma subunit [Campylobacter avium]